MSPVVGVGGSTTLLSTDFVSGRVDNGAQFVREGEGDCGEPDYQVVTFPAEANGIQNLELDRGELEFWYRPHYDAGAEDDSGHTMVSVSIDGYNPPMLSLTESDEFRFTVFDIDWNDYSISAGYHAPLWTAGDWVHIRAVWDNSDPTDSLRLYVNGTRVDGGGVPGGWSLGSESSIGSIFVGSQTPCGDDIADGIIDELIIRDAPQPEATPTPTVPVTPPAQPADTPIATATPAPVGPTPTPGGIGISDPNAVLPPAPLPLQPVGTPFADPVFGTTIRRVSNISESGGFETPIYSQLQAFSSDNMYLLLDGSNGYVIRRVDDLSIVNGLDTSAWNVPRWHPTLPHIIIHFDSNDDAVVRVQFTDVDSLTTETIFTFPAQYEYIRVNQSFDEISEDGRWLAGMVTRNDGESVIFALDVETLTLGAQLPVTGLYSNRCQPDPEWGMEEPNWIRVSPLSRYLVVQWDRDGTTDCSGLETYDLETGEFIGRVYESHQHGDLAVTPDGESEFFMTTSMSSPMDPNRPAIAIYELPGTTTSSPPTYVRVIDWGDADHISCQGPRGVSLITNGGWEGDGWTPFETELYLAYLDGNVRRLVHHRSSSCGYWVQPRASISRDGRYVVFASDWAYETGRNSCEGGNDFGAGDPYIIDLLADIAPTPTAPITRVKDWSYHVH